MPTDWLHQLHWLHSKLLPVFIKDLSLFMNLRKVGHKESLKGEKGVLKI